MNMFLRSVAWQCASSTSSWRTMNCGDTNTKFMLGQEWGSTSIAEGRHRTWTTYPFTVCPLTLQWIPSTKVVLSCCMIWDLLYRPEVGEGMVRPSWFHEARGNLELPQSQGWYLHAHHDCTIKTPFINSTSIRQICLDGTAWEPKARAVEQGSGGSKSRHGRCSLRREGLWHCQTDPDKEKTTRRCRWSKTRS